MLYLGVDDAIVRAANRLDDVELDVVGRRVRFGSPIHWAAVGPPRYRRSISAIRVLQKLNHSPRPRFGEAPFGTNRPALTRVQRRVR